MKKRLKGRPRHRWMMRHLNQGLDWNNTGELQERENMQ